jgi:sulfur carrier protein
MDATIQVNGAEEPLGVTTVAALVAAKAEPANRKGIAVAINGAVVPRAAWADTALKPGDRVEIVRVLQGG